MGTREPSDPVSSSLYVDESTMRYGEKQGLIVLGFGEDVMEVSSKQITHHTW